MNTRRLSLALVIPLVTGKTPGRTAPVLTEVLARQGPQVEFVEILNPGPEAIDLFDWVLSDGSEADRIRPASINGETILPARHLAIVIGTGAPMPTEINPRALVLNVDDRSIGNGLSPRDPVMLMAPGTDRVTSELDARTAVRLVPPQGVSVERIVHSPPGASQEWAVSRLVGGTPGSLNSRSAIDGTETPGPWLWSTGDWSIEVDQWSAFFLQGRAGRSVPQAIIRLEGNGAGGAAISVRLGPDGNGRILHLAARIESIPLGRHGPVAFTPWGAPTP